MRHLRNIFLVLDALGLIGFTIIGCQIALQMGHGFVVSAVAGVLTGVSGGILRDILCNDVPLVFRRELYASISFVAVICYWSCLNLGLSLELTVIATLVFGFTLRLIAIYFGLEMPNLFIKMKMIVQHPLKICPDHQSKLELPEYCSMDLVSRVQRLPIGRFHYTLLWVVGLGWMFDAMDTGIIAFIMATLVKDWALTPVQSGWIVSIGFVGMAIGAVFQEGWLTVSDDVQYLRLRWSL